MTTRIVEAVADKLADPLKVAAIAARPGNELALPARTTPSWEPVGLSDAHPAVALLFAELGAADPAQRARAHAHLTAALAADAPPPTPSLYGGAVSLAFAAHAAARTSGGYTKLLSYLDQAVVGQVRHWADARRARLDAAEPIGDWGGYDVISGGAGFGRHLLARYESTGDDAVGDALRRTLDVLVRTALAPDVTVDGRRVPAWWVHHDMGHGAGGGHLNLGLAHGLGGPLGLLALAWRADVRVERHAEAMAAVVASLDAWRLEDAAGPYWPHSVTSDRAGDPRRVRDVWCYGAAGLGRALYLAGAALEEKDWQDTANAAIRGVLETSGEQPVFDFALCHGWAGLLQIAWRMSHDTGDPVYAAAADGFAARIREAFDPRAPFGFRYAHPAAAAETDRPGFLEGAAGIALALHCHATGEPPVTGWDAALLLN
ncbi:lanthionine synthetase LanC family protein [Streptosporangium carneum]|uniref:Lanthionine synthetase n=1 Tax=Streptosporangium carneum TaxID=47481 RepID=A0A9W6HWG8_9ACTN|nr:lanthionine synthetase LanC family protein [Streptosporangium carneum]GLK07591.1 hypothetical protein GCM10017600_09960 [Streptosporangium carneum]